MEEYGHIKTPATCTEDAVYYKICSKCRTQGTETFTAKGTAKGHNWGAWTYDSVTKKHSRVCANDATHTETADCTFDSGVITTAATCIAAGVKTFTCSVCSGTYTEEITKLGHDFKTYTSDDNATCTKNGTKTAKCERCDATDTKEIPDSDLGHSFKNYFSNNDATCTVDGTKTATCDRTGCSETDTVADTGSALGHDYGDAVFNSTAKTHTFTCVRENCDHGANYTYTENCVKGSKKIENSTNSSCTEPDTHNEVYYCTVCDGELERKEISGEAKGHSFEAENGIQTLTGGKHNFKCSRCDAYGIDGVENATENCYGGAATCCEKAVCEVCGESYGEIDSNAHDWSSWAVTTASTCCTEGSQNRVCKLDANHTETKAVPVNPANHADNTTTESIKNIVKATGEANGGYDIVTTCDGCDAVLNTVHIKMTLNAENDDTEDYYVTEPEDEKIYTYDDEDGYEETTLENICKHTNTTAKIKNVVKATADKNGGYDIVTTCDNCGKVMSTVHKVMIYKAESDNTNEYYTSEPDDGKVYTYDDEDGYTDITDDVDKWCKHTAVIKKDAKDATCANDGYTGDSYCKTCGKFLASGDTITATGEHKFGDWKTVTKPTYESEGKKEHRCEVCGHTESEAIPKLTHDNDYLAIKNTTELIAGTDVEIDVYLMPVGEKADDIVWTSSNETVATIIDGRIFVLNTGTVTLTATNSAGLKVSKTYNVTKISGDARKITFTPMSKMYFTINDCYRIYSGDTILWSKTSPLPFRVYCYTNFGYQDIIIYVDGVALEPDNDGYYRIKASSANSSVTCAGAVVDEGGTKISFWQMLVNFIKKILSIFIK